MSLLNRTANVYYTSAEPLAFSSLKMMTWINSTFFPHDGKKNHVKVLDGLRGIAVLLVLLSHSSSAGLLIHRALNFDKAGKLGVYLFFILSAYLLDRQIIHRLKSETATKDFWVYYFTRRFLRIYPLFLVALLVYYLTNQLGIHVAIETPRLIWEHLLLLDGESIFWSIPVEFKYYFLSPLLLYGFHRWLKWNLPLISLVVLGLITLSASFGEAWNLSLISTFRYLPFFLTGLFIALLEFHWTPPKQRWLVEGVALLSALVLFFAIPNYQKLILNQELQIHLSFFYPLHAALWGSILIAAKYGIGLIKAILEWKPLRFIGTISFSLYLFHFPILTTITTLTDLKNTTVGVFLFYFISIGVASLSYMGIEKPLANIKIKTPERLEFFELKEAEEAV